jgi:Skp family chaperone for outer membrane proteins
MCDSKSFFEEPKKVMLSAVLPLCLAWYLWEYLSVGCGQSDKIGVVNVSRVMSESTRLKDISKENRLAVEKVYKNAVEKEKGVEGKERDELRKKTMMELRSYIQKNNKECADVINAASDKVAKAQKVRFVVSDKVVFGSNTVDVTDALLKEIDSAAGK